jgi:hypothetical protein
MFLSLMYKTALSASRRTRYFSFTKTNRSMLCRVIWVADGQDHTEHRNTAQYTAQRGYIRVS